MFPRKPGGRLQAAADCAMIPAVLTPTKDMTMRATSPLLMAGLVLALAACGPAAEAPEADTPAPAPVVEPAPVTPAPAPAAADEGDPEEAVPVQAPPPVAVDSQLEPKAQAGCLDEIAMATNADRTTLTVTDVEQAESGISVLVHVPGSDGRWYCFANADGTVQGTELRAN
jgi:hypothetical protein